MADEDRTAPGSFNETQMDGQSASGAKLPFTGMSASEDRREVLDKYGHFRLWSNHPSGTPAKRKPSK